MTSKRFMVSLASASALGALASCTMTVPVHPPEFPGGGPEALSPAQKQDLIAFLNRR